MKSFGINFCVILNVMALVALSVGCASTGPSRAQGAIDSIEQVRDELVLGKQQIRNTLASLETLAGAESAQLKASYDDYVKQLGALERQAKKIQALADDMRTRAQYYLDKWEEDLSSIQTPSVRGHAARRKVAAQKEFDAIKASADEAGKSFRPFLRNLQDLKLAIGNDLNPGGVKSAAKLVAKAKSDSAEPMKLIEVLNVRLNRIIERMKPKVEAEARADDRTTPKIN